MFIISFPFLLLIVTVNICQCEDDRPIVSTPLGQIRGHLRPTLEGGYFSAFEGIPYAKAPVGDKRFEEPEPIEPWKGVWDAVFQTQCAQTLMTDIKNIQGEEDCLYINIYVPREKINPNESLDVIVHIHGGAFMYGSGHSYAHPEYFMSRDVILVTFNYRLGIFGFLSTADNVVSGNNGLKDQVLALKWIQANIEAFGGNPNSVTLTGLSAGGASVHLHYFSPLSKGLFHRGFSQSGLALNCFTIQEEPWNKAKLLGTAVGCPTSSSKVLVKCLKQRPYRQILAHMHLFYGYMFAPYAPFAPVIEKGSSNTFLNKNPYYLLATGQVHDLPWITSNTAHEGLFPVAYLRNQLESINGNWVDIAPFLLDYNYTLARPLWKSTAEKIKEFYLGSGEDFNEKNYLKFVQIITDRLVVDAEAAVRLQAKVNKSPVYYYKFSYPGDHSINKTVGHGEDKQYFFYSTQKEMPSPNELKMKDVILDMLLSFAKSGKPVIEGVDWVPSKHKKLTYLDINGFQPKDMTVHTVDELAPRSFWTSLGFLENQNLVLMKDEL